MGKFYSLLTSLYFHQPNEVVLKCICVDFKGLHNGINFALLYHCIGELLSISKVSSERELTIVDSRLQTYNIVLCNKATCD